MKYREAVNAIEKANRVIIVTRISEHDMGYLKGIKVDILQYLSEMTLAGTTKFNIIIDDENDVIIG